MQANQAQAVTQAIKEILDESLSSTLFTKQDGKLLENKFDVKLHKLKSEIIMWVAGLLLAQSAILISIIKFIQ